MLTRTYSATPLGIEGAIIGIEAAPSSSHPRIQITGLPNNVVKESRERIQACLGQLGFEVPTQKIILHLSPAQIKKQGSQLDLGMAVSLLGAEGFVPRDRLRKTGFLGELSLDGQIRRVSGAVGLIQALDRGHPLDYILIPQDNAEEARLLNNKKVYLVEQMGQVIDFLKGRGSLPQVEGTVSPVVPSRASLPLLDEVLGQPMAKRALRIALAGRHHLLMVGPPGVGKSLLVRCAGGLLPPLSRLELIEVVKAHSHLTSQPSYSSIRPIRSPHHTISSAALLGGGSGIVSPGEVTLANHGVLFLDEFPEFRRDAIEGLREPLQNGTIHHHRVGFAINLPARFTLLSAMNPCPCGNALTSTKPCSCSPEMKRNYCKRISGPILDRIDLCVVMSGPGETKSGYLELKHEEVKNSILQARAFQEQRYAGCGVALHNGDNDVDVRSPPFALTSEIRSWFDGLCETRGLSYRGMHKVIKISRTIADLTGSGSIEQTHLREAWNLRCPDSSTHWGTF